MKAIRVFLKILLTIIFLPPLIYLVPVIIGAAIPVNTAPDTSEPFTTIYLVSNGLHTDIVLPVKNEVMDWTKIVKPQHSQSPPKEVNYVSFGWGDLEFYRNTPEWEDLELQTAFRSLFLKTPAAIHVRFLPTFSIGEDYRAIVVDRPQYEKLCSYINNSFDFDASGNTQPVEDLHYTLDDAFYHARGSLNLFKTCNTWVNNGLKSSGLAACLWTPFVEGIFYHY